MQNLVKRHSNDFPTGLADKVDRDIGRLNSNHIALKRIMIGTIVYWVLCKRAKWYKLTGSFSLKLATVVICYSNMMDLNVAKHDYLRNTVFTNARSFEKVI